MPGRRRVLFIGLCGLVTGSVLFAKYILYVPLPSHFALVVTGLAGSAILALMVASRRFFLRYVHEATPESLAAIRILSCAILLGSVLWEDLASTALLADVRQPMGAIGIFYALPIRFEEFGANGAHLQLFKWFTALALFLGMIGWGTRIVVPVGAVCYALFGGILRQYSYFYHQGIVPLYLLIVLSWTPCGDGWSVDRIWKLLRGRPVPAAGRPAPMYGWSQYACWVVIALPYVESGLSKLRDSGWFWWDPDNIRAFLYTDTLNAAGAAQAYWPGLSLHFTRAPDVAFTLLGICSLLIELSYGLILFSRTARWVLPAAAFLMHIGIFLLQKIMFFDLVLVQLLVLDMTKIRSAIARRLEAKQKSQVLYDGWCPLCRRTARTLAASDLFGRVEFLDFRQLDLQAYNHAHGLELSLHELEEQMYVITRGRVDRGFEGFRALAHVLPAFWAFLPLLLLPGVSALGRLIYQHLAANRFVDRKCGPECGIPPARTGAAVQEPAAPRLSWPLAISGLIAALLLAWYARIEFYPLSAWQMYSGRVRSEAAYTQVYAHYESGGVSRAYFRDAIGALAGNRSRTYLAMCFRRTEVPSCKKFLGAVAVAHNRRAPPAMRITQFEIQKWSWDFRAYPSEPGRATLVGYFLFEPPRAAAVLQ